MSVSGTPITQGFYTITQRPIDEAYLNNAVPWVDIATALAGIPVGVRYSGQQINVAGVVHIFSTDLTTLTPLSVSTDQTAIEVPITDSGDFFEATEVENALQEIGSSLAVLTAQSSVFKQNVFTLLLNSSSDVATRLVGLIEGTDYPTGWTLAPDSSVNLLITHTLTGRKIASVNVWEIDGSNETLAKPFSDGYAQIIGNGLTVKIAGLDTLAVALRVELIFN